MTFAEILPMLNVFGVVGGAIWCVAKISSAIALLNASVTRLEGAVSKMERRLTDHETRLSRLEVTNARKA